MKLDKYILALDNKSTPIYFIGFLYSKNDVVIDVPHTMLNESNDWWIGKSGFNKYGNQPSQFNFKLVQSLKSFMEYHITKSVFPVYIIPVKRYKKMGFDAVNIYIKMNKI
jgi:hypothetical protein